MDEKKNTESGMYGFCDGGINYASNLPLELLQQQLKSLERIDRQHPFLQNVDLILIDLNRGKLDQLVSKLFSTFVQKAKKNNYIHRRPGYTYPTLTTIYSSKDDPMVSRLSTRVKSPDSTAEKITRKAAEYSNIYDNSYHVMVRDIIGIKLEAYNEAGLTQEQERIRNHPLVHLVESKQHRGHYHANHDLFTYDAPGQQFLFEIQYETSKNAHLNQNGGRGRRSHSAYTMDKMAKPHLQEQQIILLQAHAPSLPKTTVNPFATYTVVPLA
jgi:hypothetical protein